MGGKPGVQAGHLTTGPHSVATPLGPEPFVLLFLVLDFIS